MNAKLKPSICYIAGLSSKNKERDKNAVGIKTNIKEIEQRFIEIALKDLKIGPNKILIEEQESYRHTFFYHSRVAKQLNRLIERETIIFKRRNEFSTSYVAGMFDAAGHVTRESLYINGLSAGDQLMLDNLGIRTNKGRIFNIAQFIAFLDGYSILLERIKL